MEKADRKTSVSDSTVPQSRFFGKLFPLNSIMEEFSTNGKKWKMKIQLLND
jgi:hypothetical protein